MLKDRNARPNSQYKPADFSLLPKVINGGIAGIIGLMCTFPLDLVKTRLQNQTPGPDGKLLYISMLDAFRKTYTQDGFIGMYRGFFINVILVTPEAALKLSCNDMFRYYLTKPNGTLPISRQMLAGALTGALQTAITSPMELFKIQMQDAGRIEAEAKAQGNTLKKQNLMEIVNGVWKNSGIMGLYKGAVACALRDVVFSVIYFPMFAFINETGPKVPNKDKVKSWWTFVSGLASGAVAAWAVTPCDVIKTRLQAGDTYKGISQVITATLQEEGVKAFFKGGLCRIIVIAPLFGIANTVYLLGVAEYLFGLE